MRLSIGFRVFALFALGYFVSYVFRGVNLGFAPFITHDLGLSAADLGLLTSVYFLGFAAVQIPAGVLLDLYGPRRVEAALLVLTAGGVALFGAASGFWAMILGRLLIGVGVSVCLGGAFKALAGQFPSSRLPFLNGLVMATGGLGGVAVGSPLSWLLTHVGWRAVCFGLAGVTLAVAAAIWFGAPETPRPPPQGGMARQFRDTWWLLRSPMFWRINAFSVATQGVFYATQSLWVGAYLRDVARMQAPDAAALVSILGVAMMAGCVSFGGLAKALERRGLSTHAFCGLGMLLFVVDQGLIILQAPVPPFLLWSAFGFFGGTGILSYAVLAERVPPWMIGRANTTITLVLFALIFGFQVGIGAVVDLWPAEAGHYPARAHELAWSLLVLIQLASAAGYLLPGRAPQWREAEESLPA